MKKLNINRLEKVEAPLGEYENISHFQMVEFKINFFGQEDIFVLDTKIDKEGRQFVIDGNGWISDGFEISNL